MLKIKPQRVQPFPTPSFRSIGIQLINIDFDCRHSITKLFSLAKLTNQNKAVKTVLKQLSDTVQAHVSKIVTRARLIGTLLPLIPSVLGVNLSIAIPFSILITILMLSINGFFVAIIGELNVKKKVMEIAFTGLVLAMVAFGVGRLTALLRAIV